MNYEILYLEAFPVVRVDLDPGESVKAESDAMIAMSGTMDVEGSMEGGFLGGLARRMLTGESFFFQRITARRGPGYALLGHPIPGGIIDVTLDGTYGLLVQKGGFLASEDSVQVDTAVQNLAQGLFSKEGFFVLGIRGYGTAFISSYGAIHAINLEPGEEVVVDNGHLVAWPDYMNYHIERASQSGWLSSMTSGEYLVCRFRGPGVVLIQTRNPRSFARWMSGMLGT